VLSAVLAGANAYLGLFAGMTVAASIPRRDLDGRAQGVSRHEHLEHNSVQTIASAGEALAAGNDLHVSGARDPRLLEHFRLSLGHGDRRLGGCSACCSRSAAPFADRGTAARVPRAPPPPRCSSSAGRRAARGISRGRQRPAP